MLLTHRGFIVKQTMTVLYQNTKIQTILLLTITDSFFPTDPERNARIFITQVSITTRLIKDYIFAHKRTVMNPRRSFIMPEWTDWFCHFALQTQWQSKLTKERDSDLSMLNAAVAVNGKSQRSWRCTKTYYQ